MTPLFANGNHQTVKKLIRLRKQAEKDGAAHVALRMSAIILSLERYTTGEIAKLLKVHRSSVPIWINNWNEFGEMGLGAALLERRQCVVKSGTYSEA